MQPQLGSTFVIWIGLSPRFVNWKKALDHRLQRDVMEVDGVLVEGERRPFHRGGEQRGADRPGVGDDRQETRESGQGPERRMESRPLGRRSSHERGRGAGDESVGAPSMVPSS